MEPMGNDMDSQERRVVDSRRFQVGAGPGGGTRSGKDRRRASTQPWPYFEKRSSGRDRRSSRDRRDLISRRGS